MLALLSFAVLCTQCGKALSGRGHAAAGQGSVGRAAVLWLGACRGSVAGIMLLVMCLKCAAFA